VSTVGELPIGTVTFLFTDIEGSTQLLKQLGGERYGDALDDHQRILREAFAAHGGHEIDTQGDSFFVAFPRAKDAVSASITCQRRLADHAWPEDAEVRVRMGIHTAEPTVGGERYVGLGVHRAARICAAGHGGQVLVSQTARELLRDDPISEVSLRDLGEHRLKDLDEPERLYQIVAPGLREDLPALETAVPTPFAGREGELAEAAAQEMATGVVGRDDELAALIAFVAAVERFPAGLVLEGEPGIGKTTLWEEGVRAARERSYRVLLTSPSGAESRLSFAALADLLEDTPAEVLAGLPAPQRRGLEVALLLADGGGPAPAQRAIAAAVLGVLRSLAAGGPVLVAIDDVQWLDPSSAAVLEFAFRRLREEPIALLLTRRVESEAQRSHALERSHSVQRLRRVQLGPLSPRALGRLLLERLGASFSLPVLRRLHDTSSGNPFFALEVGQALVRKGMPLSPGEPFPVPGDVSELLDERIAALPPATRDALLVAALASAPTVTLVEAVLGQDGWATVRPAIEAHVVVVDEERIRFVHPAFAATLASHADLGRRRDLHRLLAEVVGDPERQAWHLALSAEGADAEIALRLDEAARRAAGRGATAAAAELAERASALTPSERTEDVRRRRLDAAAYHLASGDTPRARSLLEEAVAAAGAGRATALAQLAWVFAHELGYGQATRLFHEARMIVGDDLPVRVSIERGLAWCAHHRGDLAAAQGHARAALEIAETLGDIAALAEALADVVFLAFLMGRAIAEQSLARALALEQDAVERLEIMGRPSWINAMLLEWSGDLAAARRELERLCERALVTGDENALPFLLIHLSHVERRSGNLPQASRHADDALEAVDWIGDEVERAFALVARALVDAQLGRVEVARRSASEAREIAERVGSRPAVFESLYALGFVEFSLGDLAGAASAFEPLMRDVPAAGFDEPALAWRFHPDAAETLIQLGRLAEAEELVRYLERRGGELRRPWALATGSRCRALLLVARGESESALRAIEDALTEHAGLSEPFELGRTLLARGLIARKCVRRRLARDSLEAALDVFEGLGAPLWAGRTRAELARISGRARRPRPR
jgi:class 3 adenylate cyclase